MALTLHTREKYGDAPLFDNFIDGISKKCEILFEFKEKPIERYVFKFPLFDDIKDFILKEEYFLDEVFELEEIQKEYMIPDMMNFKISTLLTLRDLMIIKRLFKMVGLLNSDYLFKAQDNLTRYKVLKRYDNTDEKQVCNPFKNFRSKI